MANDLAVFSKKFKQTISDEIDNIEIDISDLPDELSEYYDEVLDGAKDIFKVKNMMLWATLFIPFIMPNFIKGFKNEIPLPIDVPRSSTFKSVSNKIATDYARKYFEERGLELVTTLTKTDCLRLKKQMFDNWGKGEKAFSKAFRNDYANTEARLETIYRTEYVKSQNEGILARAKDSDHVYKRWNARLDERTCDVCGAQLHSVIIPIEDDFFAQFQYKDGTVEDISVSSPPVHPNCSCVITTFSEEDYNNLPNEYIRQYSSKKVAIR